MTDQPFSAREAAQLAAQGQKAQQERHREAIAPALAHAYSKIRTAAGDESGLTAVDITFRPFHLKPDQLLSVSRALHPGPGLPGSAARQCARRVHRGLAGGGRDAGRLRRRATARVGP